MRETERKWILPQLPDIGNQKPIKYERHFLYIGEGIEIRIQKKGSKFEFERKVKATGLTRTGQKFEITEDEFNNLKQYSTGSIIRESYKLNEISIKVYSGKYKGLIRAEVEFDSEQKAEKFSPPEWFGKEITDSVFGKDNYLVRLSSSDFKKILEQQ